MQVLCCHPLLIQFVSALVLASNSLNCLLPLTKSLQAVCKDIVQAVQEIGTLQRNFYEQCEDVDSIHDDWFKEMCRSAHIEMVFPQICSRQRNRVNVTSQVPSKNYRWIVTIPVLDHLIFEMKSRFTSHHKTALLGLHLVPSILVSKPFSEIKNFPKPVQDMYGDDLKDGYISAELHQRYLKWEVVKEYLNIMAWRYFQHHWHTPYLTVPLIMAT